MRRGGDVKIERGNVHRDGSQRSSLGELPAPKPKARQLNKDLAQALHVRPVRAPGESERAYLVRLAHLNGLREPGWLMRREGINAHGMARVCPACISAADPHWASAWEERDGCWCEAHDCWLVDHCSGCAKPLRWKSVRLTLCRCGYDLRRAPIVKIPRATRSALKDGEVPYDVLLWLGAFDRHGPSTKPLKKVSRRAVAEVACYLDRGVAVVAGWPESLFASLDSFRLWPNDSGSAQLMNQAFPGLTRMLRRIPGSVWRARILEALLLYVTRSKSSPWPLLGRNPYLASVSQTQKSVATALKVRVESLTHEVSNDETADRAKRLTKAGRVRRVLTEDAIERVGRRLDDRIARRQAARLLGLTAHRVQQLVQDGLLQDHAGWLSQAAVQSFAQSIVEAAIKIGGVPVPAVQLSEAMRRWVPIGNTRHVLGALQRHELPCYRDAAGVTPGVLLVSRTGVIDWALRTFSLGDTGMSIPDVARSLRQKQEVVYDLVSAGLLKTEVLRVGGRHIRAVTREELGQFTSTLVPLVLLARNAGIAPKHAYSWAIRNDIDVVSGPEVDGRRKYFVRRTDPERQRR